MSAPKTDDDLRALGFVQGQDGWTKPTRRETMIARAEDGPIVKTLPFSKPSKRVRQSQRPLMNKLESKFFALLTHRFSADFYTIRPQAVRVRLCNGVNLTPDFFVFAKNNLSKPIVFEVKGPHAFEDSLIKLKMAAQEWPEFEWRLAWKSDKGPNRSKWQEQTILP